MYNADCGVQTADCRPSIIETDQCERQSLAVLRVFVNTIGALRRPDTITLEKKIMRHILWCTCTHSNMNNKTISLSALYCSYPVLMLYKCMFDANKISSRNMYNVFLAKLQTDRQTGRRAASQTDRQTAGGKTSHMSTFIGRWTVGIRLLSSPTVT